jgi:flagellar hook-basal body protein
MAGFNTAVTGLKASTTMLDVAGNNIANASTVGFKGSRTEFGDIYATAVVGAGSSNTPGSGVTVSDIAQDFSGGTIEFTNSNLDLAINGSGFFQLKDNSGNISYTRAGAFELDKEGFIVSKNNKKLQGFGLDAQGNMLPLQDLSVSQKQSPPKATEKIELSFNIDENDDASTNEKVFNKVNPNSYTWSTTVGTFDSLGNEQSIRFYFAEQQAIRESYRFVLDDGLNSFTAATFDAVPALTADPQFGTGTDAVTLSGFELAMNSDGTSGLGTPTVTALQDAQDRDTLYWDVTSAVDDGNGNVFYQLTDESKNKLKESFANGGDPRIDLDTLVLNGATGQVSFETHAEYTEYGNFAVTVAEKAVDNTLPASESFREANEIQSFQLDPAKFVSGVDGNQLGETFVISFGSVDITLDSKLTYEDAIATITSFEQEIIDANPGVESLSYNSLQDRIEVKWQARQGDIDNDILDFPVVSGTLANAPFLNVDPGTGKVDLQELQKGDNSFIGTYRTYAYLNDNDQLNLGKLPDPGTGTGAAGESETGPILVSFNTTTGVLDAVNGTPVSNAGKAPMVTILGADPANPQDVLLDSDVDNLKGVQLDLSGASQFGSESIVNRRSQDGYTKGDLIGVTFSEDGRMVASFSNGQLAELGVVAVATFENQDGLQNAGNTEWVQTLASGDPVLNPPGTGLNGTLRSAALEQSNVDLSAELVKLIEGQRNFQANSKTLETLNTVTQAILQI